MASHSFVVIKIVSHHNLLTLVVLITNILVPINFDLRANSYLKMCVLEYLFEIIHHKVINVVYNIITDFITFLTIVIKTQISILYTEANSESDLERGLYLSCHLFYPKRIKRK